MIVKKSCFSLLANFKKHFFTNDNYKCIKVNPNAFKNNSRSNIVERRVGKENLFGILITMLLHYKQTHSFLSKSNAKRLLPSPHVLVLRVHKNVGKNEDDRKH